MWGPPTFFDPFLSSKLEKTASIQDKLAELGDPQIELNLLRSCLSVCKITHILRCVPSSSLGCFPSVFDSNLRNCLSRILCCSISDNAWSQATLPFRLGGLGLRESQRSSHPAFLGSCNSARILVSHLAPNFDVTSFFPGENCAISYFQSLSILPSNLSSQNDLQASLDDQLFASIFNTSTIRDQARLRAVAHSSGVSSGWLKAIPQPTLGLAFSPHEFVIAVRLWLGVPLFPLLPLCTCLSVIDQFGDHLLGCSHGPLRIQRHDALVSIVHHALLQDHPGVLREQSIASDQSRPGDIYHPDFTLGRPAYFDLSVRCTTQPSFISAAASKAGVAAAASEEAKDDHYLETVNNHGGEFFPLVCESFGVWTPFALSTLSMIADRTTVKSGIPRQFARKQLLQRLSVTLWRYNAKMILRHYGLCPEDGIDLLN